jgi:hypothetical protein
LLWTRATSTGENDSTKKGSGKKLFADKERGAIYRTGTDSRISKRRLEAQFASGENKKLETSEADHYSVSMGTKLSRSQTYWLSRLCEKKKKNFTMVLTGVGQLIE